MELHLCGELCDLKPLGNGLGVLGVGLADAHKVLQGRAGRQAGAAGSAGTAGTAGVAGRGAGRHSGQAPVGDGLARLLNCDNGRGQGAHCPSGTGSMQQRAHCAVGPGEGQGGVGKLQSDLLCRHSSCSTSRGGGGGLAGGSGASGGASSSGAGGGVGGAEGGGPAECGSGALE